MTAHPPANAPRGTVTVVGLGPGDPDARTVGTQRVLDRADRIVLRTAVHPGVEDIAADPRTVTCDDLYESGASFEEVYHLVTARVIDAARRGEVVFAVPGHPSFGERTVRMVRDEAREAGIEVNVLDAVSAADALALAVGADPMADGVQCLDGLDLVDWVDARPFSAGRVTVDPFRPCLVTQVYSAPVAAAVKLALAAWFPDDHPVVVVRAAGVPGQQIVRTVPAHRLDREWVDHLTSVWVPAIGFPVGAPHWPVLTRIVARLRDDGGCPWDRAQTHATLRDAVLAEAYEVVDAIDAEDGANLAEELGDLLLTICMQAQIADEAGEFDLNDVLSAVTAKLVRRHPHVFGDRSAGTADVALETWQSVKREEWASAGLAAKPDDPIDRLPRAMPALTKVGHLAAKLPAGPAAADGGDPGDRLLESALACLGAGQDPETALLTAMRRRLGRRAAPDSTTDEIRPMATIRLVAGSEDRA